MLRKRPFLFAVWTLVLGELCGQYAKKELPFIWIGTILIIIGGFYCYQIRRKKKWHIWLFLFFLLGSIHFQFMEKRFTLPQIEQGTRVEFCGKVVAQKKSFYGKKYECTDIKFLYQGKEESLYGNLLLCGIERELYAGQYIMGSGEFQYFQEATNFGQFDQREYQRSHGVLASLKKIKIYSLSRKYNRFCQEIWDFRERLQEVYRENFHAKQAGILIAMVTGEKAELDQTIKKLYQEQGIAHILAISGLHIALVGQGMYQQMRKKGARYISSIMISSCFLLFYCMIAGKAISVIRAGIMFLLFLGGEIVGRSYDLLTALSVAALILVLSNPYCLNDVGFCLSFGAVIGIGAVYPFICQICKEKGNWIFESLFISLSIQITTLPFILHTFYQFSPYSIFLNLIVIPIMSFLLPVAMIGGVVGIVSREWGRVVLFPTSIILDFYERLCKIAELLPMSKIITGELGIKFYLLYGSMFFAIGWFLWKHKYKKTILIFCCFLMGMSITPDKVLQIICADVGQGDGILIATPSNRHYLVDGGSLDVKGVGTYRLLPMLLYYGVTELDGMILTHMDADHYNGAVELFGEIKIKHLFLPMLKEKDEAYKKIERLAKEYGVSIYYQKQGDQIYDKEVCLQWLAPEVAFQFEDKNDNSQVIQIAYKQFKGIFTGDMGEKQEKRLLSKLEPCEFLKVGHHGSKNSSSMEFLEKISPKYAIISYGNDNRYGHPHIETKKRLEQYHCQIYETGRRGAILLKTDGKKVELTGFH